MIKTIEITPELNKKRYDMFIIVNILVFNPEGKIIIQQCSRDKSAGALQFDTSVGGVVTSVFSYEQAAYKEKEEELELKVKLEFLGYLKDLNNDGTVFSQNHIYMLNHDDPYTNW